jgi:hypothetical protein
MHAAAATLPSAAKAAANAAQPASRPHLLQDGSAVGACFIRRTQRNERHLQVSIVRQAGELAVSRRLLSAMPAAFALRPPTRVSC